MVDVQTMSVRLPVDLYEKLRREAFERRIPMNTLVVEGLEMRLSPDVRRKALGMPEENGEQP